MVYDVVQVWHAPRVCNCKDDGEQAHDEEFGKVTTDPAFLHLLFVWLNDSLIS